MVPWISAIAGILFGAAALAKLWDLWLRPADRKRMAEKLEVGWIVFDSAEPMYLVRGPIRIVRRAFDYVLGPNAFSGRAFFRTSLVSSILLIASLAVAGIFQHRPFAGATPWTLYAENLKIAVQQSQRPTEPKLPGLQNYAQWCVSHDGFGLRMAYCVLFVIIGLFANAVLDFVSVALLRQLLREIEEARGFLTLLAVFTFDLAITVMVSAITNVLMLIIAFPVFGVLLHAIGLVASISKIAAIMIFLGLALLVWYLAGPALQVVVVVASLPSLVVVATLMVSIVTFPWRQKLHRVLSAVFLRIAESGSAAVGYFAFFLTALATLITLLAQAIGHL